MLTSPSSAQGSIEVQLQLLQQCVRQQQKEIDTLQAEGVCLRRCIETAGFLSLTAFNIELHKEQFSRVLHRHPLNAVEDRGHGREPTLATVVLQPSFASRLLGYLEGPVARVLCEVTTTLHTAIRLPPRIYVIGGMDGRASLTSIERHDPSSGRWEMGLSLPSERTRVAATVAGGKIYVIGGLTGRQATSSAFRLDPADNQWETLPPMTTARGACAATAIPGQVYVFGGSADGRVLLSSVERFDPQLNEWTQMPMMSTPRGTCGAASLVGKVYAFGGSNGKLALNSAERFDPFLGRWEHVPPLQVARADFATAACGGKIFAIGGFADGRKLIGSVEIFCPEANCWEFVMPLLHPQAACTAAATYDSIYVFGGSDGHQASYAVQRFGRVSRSWENAPNMISRRLAAAAVALSVPHASIVHHDPGSRGTLTTESDPGFSDVCSEASGAASGSAVSVSFLSRAY